jgi:hypothetical protein
MNSRSLVTKTKLFSAAALTAAVLSAPTAVRADDPQGTLVIVPAEGIFIPNGFDDNDQALVVLDGYLPNSCHKLVGSEVKKDPTTGAITVLQYARRFDGICLQVRVPYFREVDLGVMPMGETPVSTLGAPNETLKVVESTNAGPDDYLYAAVDSARIEGDPASGRYFAVLQGRFTNTCMKLKQVVIHDSGRTVEVLPIIEMVDQDGCQEAEIPYSWMEKLPDGMTAGRHLLHVRSLNGKSVNAMFTVTPQGG